MPICTDNKSSCFSIPRACDRYEYKDIFGNSQEVTYYNEHFLNGLYRLPVSERRIKCVMKHCYSIPPRTFITNEIWRCLNPADCIALAPAPVVGCWGRCNLYIIHRWLRYAIEWSAQGRAPINHLLSWNKSATSVVQWTSYILQNLYHGNMSLLVFQFW